MKSAPCSESAAASIGTSRVCILLFVVCLKPCHCLSQNPQCGEGLGGKRKVVPKWTEKQMCGQVDLVLVEKSGEPDESGFGGKITKNDEICKKLKRWFGVDYLGE